LRLVNRTPGKIFLLSGRKKDFVNHEAPSLPRVLRRIVGLSRSDEPARRREARTTMAAKATAADDEADIDAGEESGSTPKRALPLKLIAIAAAGILVLGGGGTAACLFFFSGKSAKQEEAKLAAPKPAVFLDVPDVLVNLSNPSGERQQFLKIKIVLEVPEQALVVQIQPLMPRVMDTFQTYLRELRPADLEGSAGLYRLKEELTRRVNAAVDPARVNAVLFKELLVQ
jgi:flagellar protein FliL